MRTTLLFLSFFLAVFSANAQWFFETGFNESKFNDFVVVGGTPTELNSYEGFHDLSQSLGYLFTFKNRNLRAEKDYTDPLVHLGVGVGFDKMTLKSNASFGGGATVPVNYDFAQLQVRAGLYLMPTLVRKRNPDRYGVRNPLLQLQLGGAIGRNMFTYAVQSTAGKNLSLLRDHDKFRKHYMAYAFSAGINLYVSKHTRVYGKYEIERSFNLKELNEEATEDYRLHKNKISVGVLVDFPVKNRLKELELDRIDSLEAQLAKQAKAALDLTALHDKIAALEAALERHKHDDPPLVDERVYNTKIHEKGFLYLPDFKYVLFSLGSSYFVHSAYKKPLRDLITFMEHNPKLHIQLVGYADSKTGSPATNLELSERRAKRVYDYLIQNGANPKRLTHLGAGQTLQFGIDDTEFTENRRTEIIILQK